MRENPDKEKMAISTFGLACFLDTSKYVNMARETIFHFVKKAVHFVHLPPLLLDRETVLVYMHEVHTLV